MLGQIGLKRLDYISQVKLGYITLHQVKLDYVSFDLFKLDKTRLGQIKLGPKRLESWAETMCGVETTEDFRAESIFFQGRNDMISKDT